jgi:hypothetical protein
MGGKGRDVALSLPTLGEPEPRPALRLRACWRVGPAGPDNGTDM